MFILKYHPGAQDGIANIPSNMKTRIRRAIETRLTTAPDKYGKPLSGSLTGHRRLRVGETTVWWNCVLLKHDTQAKSTPTGLVFGRGDRVGDYRVIYRVVGNVVRILEIAYRGDLKHYD